MASCVVSMKFCCYQHRRAVLLCNVLVITINCLKWTDKPEKYLLRNTKYFYAYSTHIAAIILEFKNYRILAKIVCQKICINREKSTIIIERVYDRSRWNMANTVVKVLRELCSINHNRIRSFNFSHLSSSRVKLAAEEVETAGGEMMTGWINI